MKDAPRTMLFEDRVLAAANAHNRPYNAIELFNKAIKFAAELESQHTDAIFDLAMQNEMNAELKQQNAILKSLLERAMCALDNLMETCEIQGMHDDATYEQSKATYGDIDISIHLMADEELHP